MFLKKTLKELELLKYRLDLLKKSSDEKSGEINSLRTELHLQKSTIHRLSFKINNPPKYKVGDSINGSIVFSVQCEEIRYDDFEWVYIAIKKGGEPERIY